MWLSLLALRLAFSFFSFCNYIFNLLSLEFKLSTDCSSFLTYFWSFCMLSRSMFRKCAISLFWKIESCSIVWFMKLRAFPLEVSWSGVFLSDCCQFLIYCLINWPFSMNSSSWVRIFWFSSFKVPIWSFISWLRLTTLLIFLSSLGTKSSYFSILSRNWSFTASSVFLFKMRSLSTFSY